MKSRPQILPPIGLGFATLVFAGLLFVPLPNPPSSPFGIAVNNALHLPLFAILTALVYLIARRLTAVPRARLLLIAMALTAAGGAASEWLQALFGRTSSLEDFLFDVLGIAVAGAAIAVAWRREQPRFRCWLLALAGLCIVALLIVAHPIWLALKAKDFQARAFPLLADFESGWESMVWIPQGQKRGGSTRAKIVRSNATRGSHSFEIHSRGADWAGVRLRLAKPVSWDGMDALSFDLFNPGDEFALGVRIDRRDGVRFVTGFEIRPGANACRLPLASLQGERGTISGSGQFAAERIIFHLGESPPERRFYLDNVRLE